MKRRKFLQKTAIGSVGVVLSTTALACNQKTTRNETLDTITEKPKPTPIAICTWGFVDANARAGALLKQGIPALDAIIEGVAVEENDLKNTTVGIGGAPDSDGDVTLDACVMNPQGDCGAVMCVQHITNVAALARKVMEDSPHVILVGEGAEKFAISKGFEKTNLLTNESKKAWESWKEKSQYKPIINIENHDTIGMLAIDAQGDIAGVCTTSGLAYKMKGRVGDSPIIGSGLFVDNEVGGASATGLGEEVIKTVGSFLIVELMRNGMSPQKACEEAIKRVVAKNPSFKDFQVAFIAINKAGETGGYSIHEGFRMMRYQDDVNENLLVDFYNKA